MEQFLLAMCGIPSSGKTTLARAIKDELNEVLRVEIVSTDRWRDGEFYSDFRPEKEHNVRKEALDIACRLIQNGASVIHDDTNYYTSMRHELYDIAGQNKIVFAVVHVSTPAELAVQWNMDRKRPVPVGVIEKIEKRFDFPGSKYAWDRPIATHNLGVDNPNDDALEIVERIESLFPVISEIRSSDKSISDLLDVITRQVVKRFLVENPSMREDARISKERRSLLAYAKKEGLSPFETEEQFRVKLGKLVSRV
ncbi:MAG: AAA family ATPase [Candidatus Thorarchaeota archaeon]|jgi:O-phosphoseryl-tRNA(Sec) kinase